MKRAIALTIALLLLQPVAAVAQDYEAFRPAATVDNLSTGFGLFDGSPWEYSTAPHIAPTAWFVMAVNDFNPYAMAERKKERP